MRALNPRYLADGRIDAEIEHPAHGWIPYTAAPATGDEEMEAIWQVLKARPDVQPYDPGSEIEDRRSGAWISRTKFCLALKRAGILSPADALIAAKGDWPDTFNAALTALPGRIDQDEAQIVWAAVAEVHRMDPVLLAVQAHLSLTDAQVDALFGIQID